MINCYNMSIRIVIKSALEKEIVAKNIVEKIKEFPDVKRIESIHIFEG